MSLISQLNYTGTLIVATDISVTNKITVPLAAKDTLIPIKCKCNFTSVYSSVVL